MRHISNNFKNSLRICPTQKVSNKQAPRWLIRGFTVVVKYTPLLKVWKRVNTRPKWENDLVVKVVK